MNVNLDLWDVLLAVLMCASFAFTLRSYYRGDHTLPSPAPGQLSNPAILNYVFGDREAASLWGIVRLYVGFVWLNAGYAKIGNANWISTGVALKRYWAHTIGTTSDSGGPPGVYDWYQAFLKFMLNNEWYTWLAKVIACGETLVGVCIILGAFVGIAALFGAVLNFNYALAGSAGTNTVILLLGGLLITAWTISGYIGLDRYLLSHLGTPWQKPQGRKRARLRSTRAH